MVAETDEVLALCRAELSWAEPLVAGLLYLRAEAIWAVRREMACTLADVLAGAPGPCCSIGRPPPRPLPRWRVCSHPNWDGTRSKRPGS